MVEKAGSLMKSLVNNIEQRMQFLQRDAQRNRRELERLKLYRDVARRLKSLDTIMPEVVRAQGLARQARAGTNSGRSLARRIQRG